MWHETNCKVLRKGKIKVEGEDRYASILEYTHNDGTKKYELVFSAGLLNLNAPEDKRKETSPDIGGAITFNNIKYKFGGWRNSNDKGAEWTGVRLTPKEEGYNQQGNYNDKPFPADEPKDQYIDESAPF